MEAKGHRPIGRLQGKIVIVGGAGASAPGVSIGNACALHLAREGAFVVAADVSLQAAHDIYAQLEDEGLDGTPVRTDLSNLADVIRLVEDSKSTHGRIDGFVFNAGLGIPGGPAKLSEQDWDTVAAVNNKGYFHALKAVLPVMAAQGSGSIVAVSSVASQRYPGFPHFVYGATKAAMNQMTKYAAMEYAARGVRANTVLPGMIDTPRIARVAGEWSPEGFDAARRKRDALCPMGRTGTPWEIAYAIAFLLSDEARYITATELVVDGGLTQQFATPEARAGAA